MKKILLLSITSLILSIACFAQTEHLKFKGFPITGKLSSFVSTLRSAGYSTVTTTENSIIMKGAFAGFEDCVVFVISTPKTKTVWKIVVYLPEQTSWYSVKSRYNTYKEQYTEKYGTTDKSFEFFSDPYYEGDGYELLALDQEKCHYNSFWKVENGHISLSIESLRYSEANVKITYEDSKGAELMSKEKGQIVNDDI